MASETPFMLNLPSSCVRVPLLLEAEFAATSLTARAAASDHILLVTSECHQTSGGVNGRAEVVGPARGFVGRHAGGDTDVDSTCEGEVRDLPSYVLCEGNGAVHAVEGYEEDAIRVPH